MILSYRRIVGPSPVTSTQGLTGDLLVSLTSQVENRLSRNFIIFQPSDFSPASEVAFAHALKIALQSRRNSTSCTWNDHCPILAIPAHVHRFRK